jgi:hypothetical protein
VKCSSFAVVRLPDDDNPISHCIFYQDPQLHLRACYFDPFDTSDHDKLDLGEQITELFIHERSLIRF